MLYEQLIPETTADDVAALEARGKLWLAWTRVTLDSESTWWTVVDGEIRAEPRPLVDGGTSFRPAVARNGDATWFAACTPSGIDGRVATAAGEVTFSFPTNAPTCAVALAPTDGGVLVAWEQRAGRGSELRLGAIDEAGRLSAIALAHPAGIARRSPWLSTGASGTWLAWLEGPIGDPATARVARVDAGGLGAAIALADDPGPHEAPVVLARATGCALAWHGPAHGHPDADVLRWVRVATVDGDGNASVHHPAPPQLDRDAAGFDQGWEFPSIADCDGALWVAGRSSHGYHVATLRDGAWSERMSLSGDDWGGRGRLNPLLVVDGAPVYVRRDWKGIEIGAVAEPPRPVGPTPTTRVVPSVRRRGAPERKILFGDLHQHTALSDGCGTPENLYLGARDTRGLDFAAVTDHDRFCRRTIGPATWKYLCDVADAYDEPGRFAAFRAYEFTGARHPGPGHKCVYFGDSVPDRLPDKNVDALFDVLRKHDAIAVPHHVAWTGTGLDHHDPALQPVWEIMSVHGCYECCGTPTDFPPRDDVVIPGHFVCDALAAGHRFGFIGSTDSHGLLWHHGIAKKRNPFDQGVAAVVGADPTRASILDALRRRSCYATTGARIAVTVELDGAPMGSDVPADTRGDLRISVVGTAPLARVAVVRSDGEQGVGGINDNRCEHTVKVGPLADRPHDYLYVRVEQTDGEAAWSSPIFFG